MMGQLGVAALLLSLLFLASAAAAQDGERLGSMSIIDQGSSSSSSNQDKSQCAMKCFPADPVCGTDGVIYWCGAREAECYGIQVAHKGYCSPDNGAAGGKAGEALLLVHIVWLILAGVAIVIGLP